MKDKIRPIYSELQGYLSQAPTGKHPSDNMTDKPLWDQYNDTVDELNKITGTDYNRFKIEKQFYDHGDSFVNIQTYRTKLGGLIAKLHGEYFADEPAPFSGMPSTIITQNQHQSQSVSVQMLLEIQSKIDEKIHQLPEGKEKTFLQTLKTKLSSISNITQLISILLKTAKEIGLNVGEVLSLFT